MLINSKSLQTISILWKALSRKFKLNVCLAIVIMLMSSFAEIISIASLLPFLDIISNPQGFQSDGSLFTLLKIMNLENSNNLITIITIFFCLTVLISAFIRFLNLWFIDNLVANISTSLSTKCFENILYKDYLAQLNINSSDSITVISSFVEGTQKYLNFLLLLINGVLFSFSIITYLVLLQYQIALSSIFIFLIIYLLIDSYTSKIVKANGNFIATKQKKQIQIIQEALGSIKDIIISNSHKFYIKQYFQITKPLRYKQAENDILSYSPRFIIESSGIIFIALLSLILFSNQTSKSIISLIGAFAIAIQKLLPQLQQIFTSISQLRIYDRPTRELIKNVLENNDNYKKNIISFNKTDFIPKKEIHLKNLSFKYNDQENYIFKDLNLVIKSGDIVGVIGETGSGKSTFIDILMGLIYPVSGELYIDEIKITKKNKENLDLWRNSIAFVPQDIYLADCSILENICFNNLNEDSLSRAKIAASSAQIDAFISKLPNGYDTVVGERGSLLSGGQKQRIGIARALYKNAKFIIFDEATSALDKNTEDKIIKNIKSNYVSKTIIFISHNQKILDFCDYILEVKNGTIKRIEF